MVIVVYGTTWWELHSRGKLFISQLGSKESERKIMGPLSLWWLILAVNLAGSGTHWKRNHWALLEMFLIRLFEVCVIFWWQPRYMEKGALFLLAFVLTGSIKFIYSIVAVASLPWYLHPTLGFQHIAKTSASPWIFNTTLGLLSHPAPWIEQLSGSPSFWSTQKDW